MAFKDFPTQKAGVALLQRSLERGRLAHAYLFAGHDLAELEALALTLARTLNCLQPVRGAGGAAVDCCDACRNCGRIAHGNHPDVHNIRPESKLRVITIAQMRELMQELNLRPTEAPHKVAIIVAADRLNVQAANAFLKTLEEPPANTILILLTTEPHALLETILSRCLRLNFAGDAVRPLPDPDMAWLRQFSDLAAAERKTLLNRYQLLDALVARLNEIRSATEQALTARSPLQQYEDVEKDLREKWEEELTAAIEAEYRRRRAELVLVLQRWLRDVWVKTLALGHARAGHGAGEAPEQLLDFPDLRGTETLAQRLSPADGLINLQVMDNMQRQLQTTVQEALALEVGLLKLRL